MTTVSEAMNSVTGFDELAVEKHFGFDLYQIADEKPLMSVRSMIFVDLRHQGVADKEAHEKALSMTLGEVEAYFEDEPEDAMPDDPDSESGKGS